MKRNIICVVLFVPLLMSCVSQKGTLFNDKPKYVSQFGYKNLYIVDTIQIETPVRFITKSGYDFLMEEKNFEAFSGKEQDLFDRSDVFLLGNLPMPMPVAFFNKYSVGKDCYELLELSTQKKKDIQEVYFYRIKPSYFILMLVNGDYYNDAFLGIDNAPPINKKWSKFNYYKVVMPICLDNSFGGNVPNLAIPK